MKKLALAVALLGVALAAPALARQPKTYQVTGPILELTDDVVVVKKANEKWEIGRNADTKITGKLEVGATVTIEYRMTAATAEVKPEKGAAGAAKPKK